jgi:hypothetical protein
LTSLYLILRRHQQQAVQAQQADQVHIVEIPDRQQEPADQVMIFEGPDLQQQRADQVDPDQRVALGTRASIALRSIDFGLERLGQLNGDEPRQFDLEPHKAPIPSQLLQEDLD